MKWGRSLIYLAVLAAVAGYYYYFEVVRHAEKEKAEKEARRIFGLQPDQITALELTAKDKPTVRLKRENGEWKITEPLGSDVEKSAVDSLVATLAGLSWEVEVARESQDFKPFGLIEPVALKVGFTAGEQGLDLLVGDKNPVGGGYYARRGDGKGVFLVEASSWSLLNKGLDELRRRALFTFEPEEVLGLGVEWAGGGSIQVQKEDGAAVWRAPERADLKIKESKVRNVIEQVQWLRAQTFVEDGLENLKAHGLMPPQVTLRLRLGGDRTAELKLAAKTGEADRQIKAVGSELPSVVQVDAGILQDLPRDLSGLEDRSIIGSRGKDAREVKWTLGDAAGHVAQRESNQWELRLGSGGAKILKEPWQVSSLLWDLQQAEFQRKVEPAPQKPPKPHGRVELLNNGGSLAVLTWEAVPAGEPVPVEGPAARTVWVEAGGQTEAFEVSSETVGRAEESLGRILAEQKE
jgi:hypothetical protein